MGKGFAAVAGTAVVVGDNKIYPSSSIRWVRVCHPGQGITGDIYCRQSP